jgi:MFS family permease
MVFSQSLTPIIILWAVVGGLGASLLLPSMQSLIHGNFEGPAQRRAYALVGASAAIAAAVGPLLGGFITTYLSWRVAFGGEVLIIAIVLFGIKLVHDVPYTGPRGVDWFGAVLSALGMGGIVLGILVWEEGGGAVGALLAVGAVALGSLFWWLRKRKREGKPALLDVALFTSKYFRFGITGQTLQQIAPGRADDRAADLPADGARVQRAAVRALDRPALAQLFVVALYAGKKLGGKSPSRIIRFGLACSPSGWPSSSRSSRTSIRAGRWSRRSWSPGPASGCSCRS